MRSIYSLTPRQMEVVVIVGKQNPTEDPSEALVDIDQLLERLKVSTSKESLQFTIRKLIEIKLMEKRERRKRRGRVRITFELTELGRKIAGPRILPPVFIEQPVDF